MSSPRSYEYIFSCTQCGQCCRRAGHIFATREELATIANYLHINTDDIIEQYFRHHGNERYAMEIHEPEGCIFLSADGLCTIESVKPSQCKTYPFWPETAATLSKWWDESAYCPGIGTGKTYDINEVRDLLVGRRSHTTHNASNND